MTDISVIKTPFQSEDRSWLLSPHGTEPGTTPSITLDVSLFDHDIDYPNGYVPSGTVLGEVAGTGLFGPYTGKQSNEVQTVTEGGAGLTSFTLTYSGQTTAAIDAGATAAAVQAALEALSTVGAGNVTVTGDDGGPYTVTFGGVFAGVDVAQMTATPTGGTGTVAVATATAGGADTSADGRETAACVLFCSASVINPNGTVKSRVGSAGLVHGFVDNTKLRRYNAAVDADLPLIHFSKGA